MKKVLPLLFVCFVFSCSRDPGLLTQKWLVGVNDSAIYHLNKDGSVGAVQVYSKPGEIIIFKKDTVEVGDRFTSTFFISNVHYKIVISEPSEIIFKSEDKGKESFTYEFETHQKGVFNFMGEIKYDTFSTPIRFKFVVK